MTKVVRVIDGPHEDWGMIRLYCELTDGFGTFWEEDIYYDTIEDAHDDIPDINDWGIELEEDYIEDDTHD